MAHPKQKIYLETSVISAYFDFKKQNEPRKKETRLFWDYNLDEYDPYISDLVITELSDTPIPAWRDEFLSLVRNLPRLSFPEEAILLGRKYLNAGLMPEAKKPDAYHFAIATLNAVDILVSWNYDHLANIEKERKVNAINALNNLPTVKTEFPAKLIIHVS